MLIRKYDIVEWMTVLFTISFLAVMTRFGIATISRLISELPWPF